MFIDRVALKVYSRSCCTSFVLSLRILFVALRPRCPSKYRSETLHAQIASVYPASSPSSAHPSSPQHSPQPGCAGHSSTRRLKANVSQLSLAQDPLVLQRIRTLHHRVLRRVDTVHDDCAGSEERPERLGWKGKVSLARAIVEREALGSAVVTNQLVPGTFCREDQAL